MAIEGRESELVQVVALLGAGVVAVPLFRRLGLGSVLGYLAAGVVIGPFGLRLFADPGTILHIAELGVVMFLFIIGLEMHPSRLWNLRGQIFGLGVAQVALCGLLLTGVGILFNLPPAVAFIAAMGFTLTSTATVMQLLDESGLTSTPPGQRVVSILLLEDLAIVPLLACVALLAPSAATATAQERLVGVAIGLAALAALVAAGRWLLNPFFGVLAASKAREVMTAAALLVVLGAALLMELGGLSMAMGAFLAGVLLSESTFRHQLEADIEPFRGILLGLFFLAVGMSLDLGLAVREWRLILGVVLAFMVVKAIGIWIVARVFRASAREATKRAVVMAQGGEFAFVLYAAAAQAGILPANVNSGMTAAIILSIVVTPLLVVAMNRLLPKPAAEAASMEDVDVADGLSGTVLIIGFGRFGQVVSQSLLARGLDISIIERDVEMIRSAADFGFKVWYGDGTRLDVLQASGAGEAKAVLVCVEDPPTASRIAELVRSEFPLAKLYARAFDRGHALDLLRVGVDYQIRETVESAMAMGQAALVGLGVPEDEAARIAEDVRRRDEERLELQVTGGLYAGADLLRHNAPVPTPLTTPRRRGRVVGGPAAEPERS